MKSNLKFIIIFLFGVLVWVITESESRAGQSCFVLSEYQSLLPGESTTVLWQFNHQALADGGSKWIVHDHNRTVRCRAELFFTSEKLLEQADCYREVRGGETCDTKQYTVNAPAFLQQTLIPGDWLNGVLPFEINDKFRKYVVRELVGTVTFVSHLKVWQKVFSYDEAVAGGMLRVDLQADMGKEDNLRLVRVVRLNGSHEEIVFEQLWAEGATFWLFESKKGRRSWRLAEE